MGSRSASLVEITRTEASARELGLEERAFVPVPVIRRTVGDVSIEARFALLRISRRCFGLRRQNPNAEILVRCIRGRKRRKQGYLLDAARARAARLLRPVNPWALPERVDRVYTVSSGLGFEALCAGLPVTCFGMPFYAG